MIEIFAKVGLINCVVAAFLGSEVLIRNRKNNANLAFSLLAFFIAFWSYGYWRWLSSISTSEAFSWVKLFTFGSILIPAFFFYWVVSLLDINRKYKKSIIALSIVSATLIFNMFYTDWVIKGLQHKLIFPYWPVAGVLYIYYVLFLFIGMVSWALLILAHRFKESTDRVERSRIKYIFWGSLIGFGGGLTNFFLWFDIFIPPYLNFLVGVGLILFYYAASKHSLFNIKVIATEFFTYILWVTMFVRFLLEGSLQGRLIEGFVLILISVIGIKLISSVKKEVEQREQLEVLTKELENVNEQLKRLDQARAEFISMASHQLRTPPATVKWYLAGILSGDFGPLSPEVKKALIETQFVNNSLIALIEDLLNVSRIERGRLEFTFEMTDVVKLSQEIINELYPMAQQKKLKLTFVKPRAKLPQVVADREKLRHVINNLIDNAIKYTKKGKVEASLAQEGGDLVFKVTDTGKGVNPGEAERLFQKFGRGIDSKRYTAGLGLGLYVAKIVIAQHKGKLWVESKGEGKGSTFIFSLPLKNDLEVSGTSVFDLTKQV